MKRYITICTVVLCMMTLLIGCSSQAANENSKVENEINASSTASETKEPTTLTETEVVTETVEDIAPTTEVAETTANVEVSKQENTQDTTKKVQETEKQVTSPAKEKIKNTEPVPTNPQPQETKKTTQEQSKKEAEKPTQKETEVVKEKPKAESFDVSPYVSYAKSYANSIGLATDTVATDCWDNPISANARKSNINADIESRLNRYLREDCEGVWVWSVKESETEYLIYIGYY